MDIITLAETESKPSYQEGIKAFFKQYAVGHNLTDAERDMFWNEYKFRDMVSFLEPAIMMRRRIDVMPDETMMPREWQYVDCYESVYMAANDFGETDYYNAMSRHTIHEEAIRTWKRGKELYAENNTLLQESNGLRAAYQEKYEAELRDRKLLTKAKRGQAPQEVIDEIKNRLRTEREAERQRISKRIEEVIKEMKEL